MFILNWLEGLNNNSIVNFFVFILLFIAILNIVAAIYSQKNKNKWSSISDVFLEGVGGIYLSVGVFGTFMGITVGLLEFNVADIDASIPPLLEGLKISFVTSLVGVFCNIMSQKGAIIFLPKKHSDETSALNDIFIELQKNVKNQENFNQKQILVNKRNENFLENILSEIQKQHVVNIKYYDTFIETNDINNKKVVDKLEDFGEQLSKQATEHIVEALNQVVKDFNENMVDQFGENFKRLNNGIDNLLIWQDNYKKVVLDEINLIKNTDDKIIEILENMEKFENAIDSFTKMTNSLEETANTIYETNEITTKNTMKSYEVINEQEKVNAIIVTQLTDMKDSILSSSNSMKEDLELIHSTSLSQNESSKNQLNLLTSIKEEYKEVKDQQYKLAEDSSQKMIELQNDSNKIIEKHSNDMIELSEKTSTEQKEVIDNVLSYYKEELNKIVDKHTENIQEMSKNSNTEQKEMIRNTMETYKVETAKSLEDIVNILGNDLAALSEKFVDDYSPLTEKLQKVVHIANTIDMKGTYDE